MQFTLVWTGAATAVPLSHIERERERERDRERERKRKRERERCGSNTAERCKIMRPRPL